MKFDTMEIVFKGILFILSALVLFYIYKILVTKDEVQCLGGHYEWRYNTTLKQSMRTYICDSAKIIYK